jgi:DNA invertase Pin-like site-specific DNA recombinase
MTEQRTDALAGSGGGPGRAAPAVLYSAKSTEDKHGSIGTQLADCRELAEREGWEVAGEYSDEGFSAYSGNRGPGLARAREQAAELAPSVLVVQHSDRLARGGGDGPGAAEHLAEIMFWANRHDVRIRSFQDDATFTSPALAPVMAALIGMRNHEDSKRKSAATAAGMRRRAERGLFSGHAPFGYPATGRPADRGPRRGRGRQADLPRVRRRDLAGGDRPGLERRRDHDPAGPRVVPGERPADPDQRRLHRTGPLPRRDLPGPARGDRGRGTCGAGSSGSGRPTPGRRAAGAAGGRRADTSSPRGLLRCSCGAAMLAVTQPTETGGSYEVYLCDARRRGGPEACPVGPVPRVLIDDAVFKHLASGTPELERVEREILERARGE